MYHNNYIFIKTSRETKTPRNAEESFYYFLQNSKIRFVSYNSDHIFSFNCIFNKDENRSPYFYLQSNGETENVKVITIHISFTCEKKQPSLSFRDKYKNNEALSNCEQITQYISPYDFFKENCRQCEIAETGIMHLNRNSRILLFSKLYDHESTNYKMLYKTLCKNSNKKNRRYIADLFKPFHATDHKSLHYKHYFSIRAVEYISNDYVNCFDVITPIIDEIHAISCKKDYERIQNSKDETNNDANDETNDVLPIYNQVDFSNFSERLKWIYNITRYEIITIALNTGYSYGNYHMENLLLCEDLQSIIVTIFDCVKHLPTTNYTNLQNNWRYLEEHNFTTNNGVSSLRLMREIVTYIYEMHFQDTNENNVYYQWLKTIDEGDVVMIGNLHKFRKMVNMGSNPAIFDMYLKTRRSEYVYNSSLEIDTTVTNIYNYCVSKIVALFG